MNAIHQKLIGIFLGLVLVAALAGTARAQVKPWTVISDTSQRFQLLSSLNDAAVLDRETGLIWQRQPVSNTGQNFGVDWAFAINSCYGQSINGRPGWRLPTVEEMLNLLNYTVFGPDDSRLPLGHPFQNVLTGVINYYWTSSVDPSDSSKAYGVSVNANLSAPVSFAKSDNRGIWCVRGGSQ